MLTSNQSHIAVVRPCQSNLNEPNTSHTTALCSTKSIVKSIKQISAEANTERQRMCLLTAQANCKFAIQRGVQVQIHQHQSVSNWCKKTAMPKLRAQMPNYD